MSFKHFAAQFIAMIDDSEESLERPIKDALGKASLVDGLPYDHMWKRWDQILPELQMRVKSSCGQLHPGRVVLKDAYTQYFLYEEDRWAMYFSDTLANYVSLRREKVQKHIDAGEWMSGQDSYIRKAMLQAALNSRTGICLSKNYTDASLEWADYAFAVKHQEYEIKSKEFFEAYDMMLKYSLEDLKRMYFDLMKDQGLAGRFAEEDFGEVSNWVLDSRMSCWGYRNPYAKPIPKRRAYISEIIPI